MSVAACQICGGPIPAGGTGICGACAARPSEAISTQRNFQRPPRRQPQRPILEVEEADRPANPTTPSSVVVGLALGGAMLLSGGVTLFLNLALGKHIAAPGPFLLSISTEILSCAGAATLMWTWIKFRRVRKRSGPVTIFAGCLLWLLSVGAVLGALLFLVEIGVGLTKR